MREWAGAMKALGKGGIKPLLFYLIQDGYRKPLYMEDTLYYSCKIDGLKVFKKR